MRESIEVQRNAARSLAHAKDQELKYYKDKEDKVYEAIRTLDSEREANAILTNEIERLREALKDILPHVVTQTVSCSGDKCRESICISCNNLEDAEEAATMALIAVQKARAALKGDE